MRLGGEAESPLEKLQVDHRPGAEEGIPQTVPLRRTDFQHARKWGPCQTRRSGYNSNRVADLHDRLQCGRAAAATGNLYRRVGAVDIDPAARRIGAKLPCNKFSTCGIVGWVTKLALPSVLPSQNPGIPPVDIVRDPRIGRLWTKYKETDLPVPKFKVSPLDR